MPIIDDILAGVNGYYEGRAIADVRSLRNIELQKMQMEFDAMTPEQQERVRAAAVARAKQQRDANRIGYGFAFVVIAVIYIIWSITHAGAAERPLYDANGHYAGSVHDYGRTQTYTDRNGQFTGSAINNGNGTTSFFNRNGNFTGSAGSSIERAFNFNKR